jgi:DNA topoisomerase VI subunit B
MTEQPPDNGIAQQMAARQREISVADFFLKNRHLLGFDSPAKALLTTVKEAVDNALDACEEAGILPEITVEVDALDTDLYRVVVEDNGPGIVQQQLARIFGKLLYGSKFHKLSQSRGQQGMGISAAGMYAQLTTGKPMHILSRIEGEPTAAELFVSIDTARNRPEIHKRKRIKWGRPHGTRVEVQMEGHFHSGKYSIDSYLQQTAIANPHVTIHFQSPQGERSEFERTSTALPPRPIEIKPHPRGVELGRLIQMLNTTTSRTLLKFLESEFSRVGPKTARRIIRQAAKTKSISVRSYPRRIAHEQADALYRAIRTVPVSAPRTDCLVPIGEERLSQGLRTQIDADFYFATTRAPAVYRGNPFLVEMALAWGSPSGTTVTVDEQGHLQQTKREHPPAGQHLILRANEPAQLLRFANRVPLLYDQAGCAITRAVVQTNWRAYGLQQSKGALPLAPLVIAVHVASVWIPFTSEAKEAIASYPEMLKELKLGLQECGRRLAAHLRQESRLKREFQKRSHIEKYLPHIGLALQQILDLDETEQQQTRERLEEVMEQTRKVP